MRKTLLFVLVLSCCYSLSAQEFKGKRFINAQIGNTVVDYQSNAINHFTIGLGYGYYLTDRVAVGGMLLGGYSQSGSESSNSESSSFGIAPFVLYTVPLSEKFSIIGELSIPITFSKQERESNLNTQYHSVYKSNSTILAVGLRPGLQYAVHPRWNIQGFLGRIGYSVNTSNLESSSQYDVSTSESTENKMEASLGSSFSIGVQFLF